MISFKIIDYILTGSLNDIICNYESMTIAADYKYVNMLNTSGQCKIDCLLENTYVLLVAPGNFGVSILTNLEKPEGPAGAGFFGGRGLVAGATGAAVTGTGAGAGGVKGTGFGAATLTPALKSTGGNAG